MKNATRSRATAAHALWIAEKGLDPLIEIGPIFEGVLIHYLIGYPNASHIRVSMIPGASTR